MVIHDDNNESNPNHLDGEFAQNTVTSVSGMSKSEYQYDTKGLLRANDFVREGYTFKGWNTKADGTGTSYPDKYDNVLNWTTVPNAEITLYAQWEKKLGSETITVISEETGNPVNDVDMKLQKDVNGTWMDVTTGRTNSDGGIAVDGLHWFNYRWVMTEVPDGYVKSADTAFKINYNELTKTNEVILYMEHVKLIINSQVSDIIKGEKAPAFLYLIHGRDVAGVVHDYELLVQTSTGSKFGTNAVPDLFAGEYEIVQGLVARYVPGTPVNIQNTAPDGTGADVILKKGTAEIKFPYTIKEYGWYNGVNSTDSDLLRLIEVGASIK